MSTNTVIFEFSGKAASLAIDFTVTDSRIKKDKTISSSDITIYPGTGRLRIDVSVSRKGNKDVADWYDNFVNGNTQHMVHTASGSNDPDKLNFALQGLLKIGDHQFDIRIGQGHYSATNNWHMCGYDISARANNKSGYLDNIYYITTKGSNEFKVTYANEISEGKGFKLWAYTDTSSITPRFDLEGDALHPFPFKESNLNSVGTMQKGYAFDTTGIAPTNRDFHLQLINSYGLEIKNVLYKLNRVTGAIEGNGVLKQTAITFIQDNVTYMMNYGVSHAALPLGDESYIYAGQYNTNWMKDIAQQYPYLCVQDLVLSGSHDAGMYEVNIDDIDEAVNMLKTEYPVLTHIFYQAATKSIVAAKKSIVNVFANLAATQKDTAYTQLVAGTRYFDFRPAYAKGAFDIDQTYHVHNFIPGVLFSDFLQDTNRFLKENTGEFAIIRIASSGIDRDYFTPLSKSQVEICLQDTISKEVDYEITESIERYYTKTMSQMAAGKRLIVLYNYSNLNDSYNDYDYSQSLTDPSSVLNTLNATLQKTGSYQYTVLQLQDTGSAALKHYIPEISEHLTAWLNDLVFSATGNLLQATKPIFDNATYQWLTEDNTINGIAAQHGPVMVQNDFVDVALYKHALALTLQRYNRRC
ncbi:flagellin [Moorena producens]|uniref:flagellin n=1 Tax=Moorena producens TaxID=1155739 RepID=UPI003C76FDBD